MTRVLAPAKTCLVAAGMISAAMSAPAQAYESRVNLTISGCQPGAGLMLEGKFIDTGQIEQSLLQHVDIPGPTRAHVMLANGKLRLELEGLSIPNVAAYLAMDSQDKIKADYLGNAPYAYRLFLHPDLTWIELRRTDVVGFQAVTSSYLFSGPTSDMIVQICRSRSISPAYTFDIAALVSDIAENYADRSFPEISPSDPEKDPDNISWRSRAAMLEGV